jgi:hypothetical protein
MKYVGFDDYKMDAGEPAMRSCPECNGAHEHLRNTDFLHVCFQCGKYWIFGRYLDSFKTVEEMDAFMKEHLEVKK